jgi:hypothetical protein
MPPFYMQVRSKSKIGWMPSVEEFFSLSQRYKFIKKNRQPFQVGGFFSWGLKRLLLARRQVRAAAVRHFCRHADAFAQHFQPYFSAVALPQNTRYMNTV